jgi:hypothetical protein
MVRMSNVIISTFHIFLRCQEVVEEVGKLLKTTIQLNVIPIIIHQEDPKDAMKYMEKCKDLNVKILPFARTTEKLQRLLDISSASLYNHAEAMVKTNALQLMNGPKKRFFTIPFTVINPFSKFGIVFFENGIVKRQVIFSKLYKRIDFGLFVNDTKETSTFDPQILQYFKGLELKEKTSIIYKTNESEEKRKSVKKVEQVLQSDLGRFYFKAYATSEFSVENILFYEEVMNFKNMKNSKTFEISKQIEKAATMIQIFLTKDSIMEVNTNDTIVEAILGKLQEFKNDTNEQGIDSLFDELLKDIVSVLEDTFSRFIFSHYHQEYQKGLTSTNQIINYLI